MDFDVVLLWIVCASCLAGLIVTWKRVRFAAPGWIVVYLAILLLSVTGWLLARPAIIYTAAAIWFVLVLVPGLIGKLCNRRFIQQRYAAARQLARIIGWLHPADGCRDHPEIIRALELAQQGEFGAAEEILKRFGQVKSLLGLVAIINLYRMTNQWEELLVGYARHREEIERIPQLLGVVLRARGETGDVRGLIELYDARRRQIGKLAPAVHRDGCRLMLFAFCGKRQAVEALFGGSLAITPAPTRAFWLATADLAAGATETAKRQLEDLLPVADPPLRRAIERRLARQPFRINETAIPPEPLDATAERVLEEAEREHGHEEQFGGQRSLFSHAARATQILIALNILMFLLEIRLGGSTDPEVLYRLGALFPPAVRDGEWWRLLTPAFLHFGPLHLATNMIGLWILGPFTEFALGLRRFLLVYLAAGIGSMATVMLFGSPEQMTAGASGCIMGLVGATGALMLRGWLREKAPAAKRRLVATLLIVLMQTLFDSVNPQVSMTAHLSGAFIGFALTMVLRDRLRPPVPRSSISGS